MSLDHPDGQPWKKLASWESGVEENARTIPKHRRRLNHDEPSASYMSRSHPSCLKCSHYIRYEINNHFSCFHMFRYICLCHILQLFESAFYMLKIQFRNSGAGFIFGSTWDMRIFVPANSPCPAATIDMFKHPELCDSQSNWWVVLAGHSLLRFGENGKQQQQ